MFQDLDSQDPLKLSKGRECPVHFLQLKVVVRINQGLRPFATHGFLLLVARSLSFIPVDRVCGMLMAQHGVKKLTGIWQHNNTILEFLFKLFVTFF